MYHPLIPLLSANAVNTWAVVVMVAFLAVLVFVFLKRVLHRILYYTSRFAENWLPVVDDSGNIIGRVARRVSMEDPHRYQHPLVRVMVWYNGKLYLTPRSSKAPFEQGMMDHPMERLVRYGESIDEVLAKLCSCCSPDCDRPRFLLKYKHENKEGKWLVLLYQVTLTYEAQLILNDGGFGKFWPLYQVSENKGMSYFSTILEGEIDFINSITFLEPVSSLVNEENTGLL